MRDIFTTASYDTGPDSGSRDISYPQLPNVSRALFPADGVERREQQPNEVDLGVYHTKHVRPPRSPLSSGSDLGDLAHLLAREDNHDTAEHRVPLQPFED
ncbi:hypothetical protein M011DRAFT_486483 [Sporormia fimetaria CBS 119925]|uniref:Uncharacterized protein n=1 Tax=Sporormia fimetaria CBS 119925 TaxID=1340428 RepID=A0A6A6VEQ7_9PLEO|nr:hypothetical protein M011DRAFT_486483 [Sporormia fimetaria CBS 119925]